MVAIYKPFHVIIYESKLNHIHIYFTICTKEYDYIMCDYVRTRMKGIIHLLAWEMNDFEEEVDALFEDDLPAAALLDAC